MSCPFKIEIFQLRSYITDSHKLNKGVYFHSISECSFDSFMEEKQRSRSAVLTGITRAIGNIVVKVLYELMKVRKFLHFV